MMKHLQKSRLLDLIRLLEVYVCWIHRSSQLCSLLSIEYLLMLEGIVQFLSNMCLYDVCSLIITEPHTNQI
jgi:hypothetical protein